MLPRDRQLEAEIEEANWQDQGRDFAQTYVATERGDGCTDSETPGLAAAHDMGGNLTPQKFRSAYCARSVRQGGSLPCGVGRITVRTNVTDLDIRLLEEADAATLRRFWAGARVTAPPKTFTSRLMRLSLAWSEQARREGAEPAKTRRDWNWIIKERIKGRSIELVGSILPPTVCNGTRLLKDWGGTTHEVLVVEEGATWNGQSYSSLSAVARAITGTNRNGPKFFGLREGGKQ